MPDSSTEEQRKEASSNFNWGIALLKSDPELWKIFNKAIDPDTGGWTQARFIAEVTGTKWFKTHADSWRQMTGLRLTDPATWKARRAATISASRDAAAGMGAILSDKQLARFADDTMMLGWNESQQRDHLARYVKVASGGDLKGQYIGVAGQNATELARAAGRNGYKIPKEKLAEWNKVIMSGNRSVDDYKQFIRNQAAAAFPTFAAELKAGADLEELASPYKSSMARILEIPEGEVTLFDPKIRKALASKDTKTGKPTAVPLWEFEDSLRNDSRWQFTDNAHQEVMGQTLRLGQMFGVTG